MLLSEPHDSYHTIEDSFTRRLTSENREFLGIPDISDIPVNVVNRVLYGKPKPIPQLNLQRSYRSIVSVNLDN